jgi:CubicO group peptidase (beta-lactamase class C family)
MGDCLQVGHLSPFVHRPDAARVAPHFPPQEVGVGIIRFALPRYFSPFRPAPSMVGHSGGSGAVLFYVPDLDLYISGTVNQIRKRSLSYNVMVRLVFACQDCWGKR